MCGVRTVLAIVRKALDAPSPSNCIPPGTNDAVFGFIAVPSLGSSAPMAYRAPRYFVCVHVCRRENGGFWGDEVVSRPDDDKTPRRVGARQGDERQGGEKQGGGGHGGGSRNVGDALRAVYQDAVSESVPDEMLDLLKKLG